MTKQIKIAVIPGDGTGPEVVAEGLKVLEAVARLEGLDISYQNYSIGGDHYLATGEILSDDTLAELAGYDAMYLGAIGHPDIKPGFSKKESF